MRRRVDESTLSLLPDCLNRLPEPAFDIMLAEEQTTFVAYPVSG
jgi:hypothetical protein